MRECDMEHTRDVCDCGARDRCEVVRACGRGCEACDESAS